MGNNFVWALFCLASPTGLYDVAPDSAAASGDDDDGDEDDDDDDDDDPPPEKEHICRNLIPFCGSICLSVWYFPVCLIFPPFARPRTYYVQYNGLLPSVRHRGS